MKLSFRWYGKEDPIPIEYIKQIPRVAGIASALCDVPIGEVWLTVKLKFLKKRLKRSD